jgi:NADH:ubiquinone oxidoreductase subunit 4 (subunit M)
MVLAAMYMLRLISAVLHQAPGPAVSEAALDLRPAELGVLVPLVAILLVLSAWPAAITDRSFGSSPRIAKQPLATEALSQFRQAMAELSNQPPGTEYTFPP